MLPANYGFVAADSGTHSFNATLKTAGEQSITATDTATASIIGAQNNITVNPAATDHLVVANFTSETKTSEFQAFGVTAYDAFRNETTAYTGTVHFTSSDGQAMLPANYGFVAADSGTHTFFPYTTLFRSQSITATDTATASIIGAQNNITVNPAATDHLVVANF